MARSDTVQGVPADEFVVRRVEDAELGHVAALLHDFNTEFGEPAPAPDRLASRLRQLLAVGDMVVLVAGDGPDGLVVLRFRGALWSSGLECYVAELYVAPHRRGHGIGRALMEAAVQEARDRGADSMEIGVDEPDTVARRLYEDLGFTNRTDDGALMYVYERPL